MKKYVLLAKNTAIFALGNVLSKLILSLLLPLYTRTLTTAEYGVAELITSYTQLIIPVASLSIGDALFRFEMDKKQDKKIVLSNTYIVLSLGTILLFVFMPFLGKVKTVSQWNVYLVIISVLSMWRSVFSLYAKAINKTVVFAIDNIVFNLVLSISNISLLLSFRLGISGYFLSQIVANIVSIIFLVIANNILKSIKEFHFSIKVLKSMLIYSFPLILNSISWGVMGTADRVMLTKMIDESSNGIYAAAAKIPSLLSMITGVFTQAWALSAIQDFEEERDNNFYENVFKVTHFGVTFGVLILFLCNNTILPWFLGESFRDSSKYVPCLLIGAVFLTYSNFFTPLFSALKNTKIIMMSALVATLLNIIVNYFFIPFIGIMGACVATTISYLVIFVIRFLRAVKLFELKIEITYVIFTEVILITCGSLITLTNLYAEIITVLAILVLVFIERKLLLLLGEKIKRKVNINTK